MPIVVKGSLEILLGLYEFSIRTWIEKKETSIRESEGRAFQEEEVATTTAPKQELVSQVQRQTGGWCSWISCLEEAIGSKGRTYQTWGERSLGHRKKLDFFLTTVGREF